jgi:hypothetical protein
MPRIAERIAILRHASKSGQIWGDGVSLKPASGTLEDVANYLGQGPNMPIYVPSVEEVHKLFCDSLGEGDALSDDEYGRLAASRLAPSERCVGPGVTVEDVDPRARLLKVVTQFTVAKHGDGQIRSIREQLQSVVAAIRSETPAGSHVQLKIEKPQAEDLGLDMRITCFAKGIVWLPDAME